MKIKHKAMFSATVTLSILAGYVLLSPVVAAPLYSHLLFYPNYPARYEEDKYKIGSLEGVEKQDLYIPVSNGTKLHAWLFRRPGAKYLAVVNHGNAGNVSYRTGLAEDLLQLGVSVLLFDYEGYGLSSGSASIPGIARDGLAAFDYATKELGYRDKDIILYGESLGCAVACETSAHRDCAALILQSGFSSLKSIAGETLFFLRAYPTTLFPKPSLDNLAILERPHKPLLIVHGQLDDTIPVAHSQRLFEKAAEPKRLVLLPNSGHYVDEKDQALFMDSLRSFLSTLPAAQTASSER